VDKDLTDIVLMVFDSGERMYHLVHLRHGRGTELDHKWYPWRGHQYLLELSRAYRIKWAPWRKVIINKKVVKKMKKGLEIKKTKRMFRLDKTIIELLRAKRVGMLFYQMPPKDAKPMNIEPMHISRIHQPSGELRG